MGIRHAIWASVVSGAISGRMLWWQDGWDQFEKADVCRHYEQAAAPAAAFVQGMDFTGFAPMACEAPGLLGGLLGNERRVIGWFRDAQCVPPAWPTPKVRGRVVTMSGFTGRWEVEYVDPVTGRATRTVLVTATRGRLKLRLPNFEGSIAFRLTRRDLPR